MGLNYETNTAFVWVPPNRVNCDGWSAADDKCSGSSIVSPASAAEGDGNAARRSSSSIRMNGHSLGCQVPPCAAELHFIARVLCLGFFTIVASTLHSVCMQLVGLEVADFAVCAPLHHIGTALPDHKSQ